MQADISSKGQQKIQTPRSVWKDSIRGTSMRPATQRGKCSPSRIAGLSSIKLPAAIMPEIEVAVLLRRTEPAQFINVEKALADLFPILMRHDQIREQVAEKKWKPDTPSWKVFAWLAERYLSLLPINCNASIIVDDTGEYAVKNEYDYPEITSQLYSNMFGGGLIWSIPVEEFTIFEKSNPAFFQLLSGMLILFEDICDVPLFYNHYYYEMEIEWLAEALADMEDEEDRESLDQTLKIYTNGPAYRYEQILKNMSIKLDDFGRLYNAVTVKNSQEKSFLELATDAKELFYSGSKMFDFVDHDDFHDRYPEGYIAFPEYMFFAWSVDDHVFENILQYIGDGFNSGLEIVGPSISQVLTSKNKETIKDRNPFPLMLAKFFEKASYIGT